MMAPANEERGDTAEDGLLAPQSGGRDEAGGGVHPAVRLRKVRKRFGYRDVLRGIDLEVPRGSCFVLTGANGAGKTTVLKVIAAQWTFASGEAEVLGLDVKRAALQVKASLGAVFHESFLRRELSLEENLKFAAGLHGLGWDEVAGTALSLLEKLGLHRRRRDLVSTFSQGMTKRANLIRSLLHGPELWILDEPFAGLDSAGCELLEAMIADFTAGGGTILLVTHQAGPGERLASDGALLKDGRVVASRAENPADEAAAPLIS